MDLTGQRFERLTVLEFAGKNRHGHCMWKCLCDCKATKIVYANSLKAGLTRSCGCFRKEATAAQGRKQKKVIDLVGQRFERLVVLEFVGSDKNSTLWKVSCDCTGTKIVRGASLKTGRTRSCGCLSREITTKHGHSSSGGRRKCSPIYNSWTMMKDRCLNPNATGYRSYGGANPPVTICDRWNPSRGGSFENFLEDMGPRPVGTTLGRYGDVGPYEKSNCAWQNPAEQAANRRPDRSYNFKKKIAA
jgi:hypothetical protein